MTTKKIILHFVLIVSIVTAFSSCDQTGSTSSVQPDSPPNTATEEQNNTATATGDVPLYADIFMSEPDSRYGMEGIAPLGEVYISCDVKAGYTYSIQILVQISYSGTGLKFQIGPSKEDLEPVSFSASGGTGLVGFDSEHIVTEDGKIYVHVLNEGITAGTFYIQYSEAQTVINEE